MRIMGLDIGSRKIGVAISDELGVTAQGLKSIEIKSKDNAFEELVDIIKNFKIDKIVIGLPKNMDGSIGRQAEKVLKWIEEFKSKINLPIETWDERLSTVEASKLLIKADLSRKKRKHVIDKLAAVLILQGYIDQIRNIEHDVNI
jgi:putative Holliday junction resolvase